MKKTILVFAVLLLAIGFISCQSGNDESEGYKSKNGLVYKFHKKSDNSETPKLGDFVSLDMVYGTDDSIMFDSKTLSKEMKMPMINPSFNGDIYDALSIMSVGDSATFIMSTDSVFKKLFNMKTLPPELDSIKNIYFSMQLNSIINLENEPLLRSNYIAKNYPNAKPTASGLYYIETKGGSGSSPAIGEKVKVHYTGTFLDGAVFDSSKGIPFEFTIGQGSVIPGWDEGVGMMKKGGAAVLIIPSNIAYGPDGRSGIPPYSTLVFEIELVNTWVPSVGSKVFSIQTFEKENFKTVMAKVLEKDGRDYRLEYLEDCIFSYSLSGKAFGEFKGYTYWERDGDVYQTREKARSAGKSKGYKLW